jgi:predicted naringenin-chalcone synthase
MTVATYLNRIGTAVPPHDVHDRFLDWALSRPEAPRARALFARMAGRAGIAHRWSVLPPDALERGFYADAMPGTAARMRAYAEHAPELALAAIGALGDLGAVTHLVVASCTGFIAPGLDQVVARQLGLDAGVERTLVGFMGCYAAVTALRTAHHIVRSRPEARVLVVTVELCTLHLQPARDVEPLLAMLLFGDGAAAAIVSAQAQGLEIRDPFSLALPDSGALITWTIGDTGFEMVLSGAVPQRIAQALGDREVRTRLGGAGVDGWAVHAGGRTILDAVAQGLGLEGDALAGSRGVLHDCGNMSSSTLMFVLARALAGPRIANGRAIAFGPGLAAEGFGFRSA